VQSEITQGLAQEATHLHRVFFRKDPPSVLLERYVAAHDAWSETPGSLVERVVSLGLDAEAVEFAVRIRSGPNALTRKIRILFYLLEPRPEYLGWFIGDGETWPCAVGGIIRSLLHSAVKYIKGEYLLRRHGLI
jgi:hypothetical protein